MSKLKELRSVAHKRTLSARSIEAIVQSARFERLWDESTHIDKQNAEHIIWKGAKKELMAWMSNHASLDLGERPLVYLRARGRKLRVKNWSRLSKPELIGKIEGEERDEQK